MKQFFRSVYSLLVLAFFIICIGGIVLYPTSYSREVIKYRTINICAEDSIQTQRDSLILPVKYLGYPEFSKMSPKVRKAQFINFILPAALIVYEQLKDDLKHVDYIEKRICAKKRVNPKDTLWLKDQFNLYNVTNLTDLKERIFPHPISIVIAQAALESGWGTSRFFREGNNIFGVWSYSLNDNRLKAGVKRGNKTIYVKAYDDYIASIEGYYQTIGRVNAYRHFRKARMEKKSPENIVESLTSYSEEDSYPELLKQIIKRNDLKKYDSYRIKSKYKYIPLLTCLQ